MVNMLALPLFLNMRNRNFGRMTLAITDLTMMFEFSFADEGTLTSALNDFALKIMDRIEIYVTNGDKTYSAYSTVNTNESALSDDYEFLSDLWRACLIDCLKILHMKITKCPYIVPHDFWLTQTVNGDGNLTRTQLFELP